MNPFTTANYFDIQTKTQKLYSARLEPVCEKWGLTRCEIDVMLFLYNNPAYDRAADIVSRRGIAKSHVSLSVNSLAEKSLLERYYSESDRRIMHLKLTSQGRAIAAEARTVQDEFFRTLFAGISEAELEIMQSITQKVCENIEHFN